MIKASADRMTLFVAAFGVAVTIASYCVAGRSIAYSTLTGAGIGVANFLLLRAIVVRVVEGDMHRKLPLIGLIFLKMGGLMGLVYWVIAKHWVQPIAFTIGLSSLVVGLIVSSLFGHMPPTQPPAGGGLPGNSASES
jgi:hypothetical protein